MATTTSGTGAEFSGPEVYAVEGEELPPGIGPYQLAWRRLRRNKVALFFGGVFVLIVVMCLLAPVYAHDIAHTDPNVGNQTGTIPGHPSEFILSATGVPIGPTWHFSSYFLGADEQGRDVAARLLYGGRNSLEIGAVATLLTMIIATIIGLVAGYFRGWVDVILRAVLDVIWAYPAVLLGIALGTALAIGSVGPLHGNMLLIPAFVIGLVTIPYVAKPIRGQVLTLREREFIDAARQQGLSDVRIIFSEVLPNVASTIIVFIPLILANAILFEAGLTYLGAGVQPPNASWGTMISEGIGELPAAFHLVLVPGIMLVLTVLSVNVLGDGLRDALDPRAKVKI
jgi:peptide/nickel transport system permease protein